MTSHPVVNLIQAEDTIDLRSRILRPGQNLELCRYPEDNLPTSFHLGIFEGNKVICNGTFIQQGHSHFPSAKLPYRLRGMASDKEYQRQGLGQALLKEALVYLKQKNCDLIWFNARVSAEGFYKKLGYQKIDEIFDIPTIGPHKVMFQWLNTK
jgi:GNAT superfamily N-acetyltransferase